MELLSFIIDEIKPVEENGFNIYFNGPKVAAIEKDGNYTFVQHYQDELGNVTEELITLMTEKEIRICVKNIELTSHYVIPKFDKLVFKRQENLLDNDSRYIPECVFGITDYGMFNNPDYRGVVIYNDIIDVQVKNYSGKIYESKLIVDTHNICGMGRYDGSIANGYKFYPIGTENYDGNCWL